MFVIIHMDDIESLLFSFFWSWLNRKSGAIIFVRSPVLLPDQCQCHMQVTGRQSASVERRLRPKYHLIRYQVGLGQLKPEWFKLCTSTRASIHRPVSIPTNPNPTTKSFENMYSTTISIYLKLYLIHRFGGAIDHSTSSLLSDPMYCTLMEKKR